MNIEDNFLVRSRSKLHLRRSYSKWIGELGFNTALNLNFNSDVRLPTARWAVRKLFRNVDRRLLGTRFHKQPIELRTNGVFAFEHLESNLHAHGLIKVGQARGDSFFELFPGERGEIWSAIWPSGTYEIKAAHDPAGFAHYFLKEQGPWSESETMLWLDEFSTRP